jgi:hypothetical protein
MQHWQRAGARAGIDIDHFDPRLKNKQVQRYNNLFLSTRHCNRAKWDTWPTTSEQKLGLRFLNCCEEQDFGVHIFEDPKTHELVGITPAGRYHIRVCDLNAPHFVEERRQRAELISILEQTPVTAKRPLAESAEVLKLIDALKEQLHFMIPPIPPPPTAEADVLPNS